MNESIRSEFLDYAELEKDEMKAVLNQTLFLPPKSKSKLISSVTNIDIEWASESLSWLHLQFLLRIA
jgi:hypothetical protein